MEKHGNTSIFHINSGKIHLFQCLEIVIQKGPVSWLGLYSSSLDDEIPENVNACAI